MRAARRALLLALVCLTLSACGQRGALYLPGTPDPAIEPPAQEDEEQGEREDERR